MKINIIKNKIGIRGRIFIAATIPAILISILLGCYYIINWTSDANNRINVNGSRYSLDLAKLSEFALFTDNVDFLVKLSQSIFSDPDVFSVRILNKDKEDVVNNISPNYKGIVAAEDIDSNMTFMAVVRGGQLMTIEHDEYFDSPVTDGFSDILGWIEVIMTDHHILGLKRDKIIHIMMIMIVVIAASLLLAYYIASRITKPILNIKDNVEKIASGKTVIKDKSGDKDELGDLENAFFDMAIVVNNSRFELQKQVDIATARNRDTITSLEKSNAELRRARESMQRANEAKSEFLARMSHEIRTPLHSIIGFLNLIKRTDLNSKQSEFVRVIDHASGHLLQLINDILDISSLDANAVDIAKESLNIRDCLEDAVLFMSPAAHNKGLELIFLIDSDVPLHLLGDCYHLKQVIINLVSNAIKFTNKGEVVISASLLSNDLDSATILISVSDSGEGIAPEKLDMIQMPFYQADNSKSRGYEGAGLGLAIVKTILKLMGASLSIKSTPELGSEFSFSLTLNKEDNDAVGEYHNSFSGKKILCCDSHRLALRSLRNQLLTWSHKIYTAPSLERAEELLRSVAETGDQPFDLFIAGVDKATADSGQFRDKLLSLAERYPAPLLLLIGDEGRHVCTSLSSFADCVCITKPVAHNYLHATINGIFSNKQLYPVNSDNLTRPEQPSPDSFHATSRVLLAEDNDFNRLYVSSLLCDRGMAVTEARTGTEALKLALDEHFDLILMDIHLPEMDGLIVSRKIQAESELNNSTPILALTADVYIQGQTDLKAAGIADVIIKPINEQIFWNTLAKWLNYRHEEDPLNIKKSPADEIKQNLLPRLIEELPGHSSRIHAAFVCGDRDGLAEHLHQLKGVAGYFQLSALSDAAAQADLYVRNAEAIILDEVRPLIERIDEKIQAILSRKFI